MGPAVAELMAAIEAQGLAPTGPLFNHYLSMDSGLFDFEVGVPVSAPIAPTGRVQPGHLPAARVARATYHGPYEGLHHAWRAFGELARAEGLKPAGGFWECYVVGPGTSPDSTTWRTELNQPLLG
jgi:effector-binding domain-containing protein